MESQGVSKKTKVWLSVMLTVTAAAIAGVFALIAAAADSRQFLTLGLVVDGLRAPDAQLSELVEHVDDVTKGTCPTVGCAEAVQGNGLTLFRFTRSTDAEAFANNLRIAVVSDRIVARINDATIPASTIDRLRDQLDGIWRSQ